MYKSNFGNGVTIQIELDGNVLGTAKLDKSNTFITNIRIDENHRRKGLGSAIYDFTEFITGVKLKPSPIKMSPSARKFWEKRNKNNKSAIDIILTKAGFDPNQPRASDGQWGKVSGPQELTETDAQSIDYYTKNGYKKINEQLISGQNDDPATTRAINRLNEAISKIENYKGVVYRGDSFNSNNKWFSFLHAIKNKDTFTYKGFMSTSEQKYVAEGFHDIVKGAAFFTINSKTGKSIKPYSDFYHELEVLFKPNTTFKIDNWEWVNEDRKKKMNVTLTEI